MIAWKLFRQMKDGRLAPLFINKSDPTTTYVCHDGSMSSKDWLK